MRELREQPFLPSFELSFSNYSFALQIGQLGYLIGAAVWRLCSACGFLFISESPYKRRDPTQENEPRKRLSMNIALAFFFLWPTSDGKKYISNATIVSTIAIVLNSAAKENFRKYFSTNSENTEMR